MTNHNTDPNIERETLAGSGANNPGSVASTTSQAAPATPVEGRAGQATIGADVKAPFAPMAADTHRLKIIGLTGPAGAGKDTAALHLCAAYGFASFALADPIRKGIMAMFDMAEVELVDRSKKEQPIYWLGKSPRQLMQTLGTEWGRQHVADDIWLRLADQRIAHLTANAKYLGLKGIVITDIRFPNEAEWIRQRGDLVHITRQSKCLNQSTAKHASEQGIAPLDCESILINDSTIADLYRQIEAAIGFNQ